MQTDRRPIAIKSRTISRHTPIPPRASAHPEAIVKAQPRYPRTYQASTDDDITERLTIPSPVVWQYETSQYVAESSLASLSLFTPRQTPRPPSIDVLDTQPVASIQRHKRPDPANTTSRDIADIDTAPPPRRDTVPPSRRDRLIVSAQPHTTLSSRRDRLIVSAQPHTTKPGMEIADIPTIPPGARRQRRPDPRPSFAAQSSLPTDYELFHSAQTLAADNALPPLRFNPFDRFRWWLLYPGRLETLLWSGGAVLLVGLTIFLSVVTVLSLVVSHPDQANSAQNYALHSATAPTFCSTALATNSSMQKCVIATAASPDGLQISLSSTGPFMAGTTVHLQGHGFSPSGRVIITHDINQPSLPGAVQVDQHGDFNLVLSLSHNLGWSPGDRSLIVEDAASGHRVMLAFVLCTKK